MHFKSLGMLSLLGLLTFSLAACGKNTDLSFAEAQQQVDKNSEMFTQMILGTTPHQQTIELQTHIQDRSGVEVALSLRSQSEQDRANTRAKWTVDMDADVSYDGETAAVSGSVLALLSPEAIFLQVKELWISSSDPSLAMVSMMVSGIKGQRWKVPLEDSGTTLDGVNTYLATLSSLQSKSEHLYTELGNAPYQGKFTQFNGERAYQFTIDQQAYQELFQEIFAAMEEFTSSLDWAEEEPILTAEDIQIPVFEGNLVILDADDVLMVVDAIEVTLGEEAIIGEFRYGSQGMHMYRRDKATDQVVMVIDLKENNKKTYTLEANLADMLLITGKLTAKFASSQASITFDGSIDVPEIPELAEGGVSIPLKGSRSYKAIKSVNFQEPADAVDLRDMLGGLLGEESGLFQ